MTLSLSLLLYIYFAFVVIWFLFSLVAVYHVVKFSQISSLSFFSVLAYTGGSLVLLNMSYYFLKDIDWETTTTILNGFFQLSL